MFIIYPNAKFISIWILLLLSLLSCKKSDEETINNVSTLDRSSLKSSTKENIISVNSLGVSSNSSADQTSTIQSAIWKQKNVFFPKGVYIISKSLRFNSGQTISGESGTVFKINSSISTSADFNFFLINGLSNIKIDNIQFEGLASADNAQFAVYALKSTTINVTNISAKYCGVLKAAGGEHIYVGRSFGYGRKRTYFGDQAILMSYVQNWQVKNSSFEHYSNGVQWWGGDSHPEIDGDINNPRGTKYGRVENVTVKDIKHGGIWGSMGERIYIKSCKVYNCEDTGIDFEGCFDSTAELNTINNCVNGGLTTFYYNRHITFKNNVVTQSNETYPLARIYGLKNNQFNGDVLFVNNKFTAKNGVGFINQYGPSNNISFISNTLENVSVDFNCTYNKRIFIEANTFTFNSLVKNNGFMLRAGGTKNQVESTSVIITNNKINVQKAQDPSVYAISIYQDDDKSTPVNTISNNTISGMEKILRTEWWGKNPRYVCKTYFEGSSIRTKNNVQRWDNAPTVAKLYVNGLSMAK